jgi:hypothetical protein
MQISDDYSNLEFEQRLPQNEEPMKSRGADCGSLRDDRFHLYIHQVWSIALAQDLHSKSYSVI